MTKRYTILIQSMIDKDLMNKIDKARGDIPKSIFIRKQLEKSLK